MYPVVGIKLTAGFFCLVMQCGYKLETNGLKRGEGGRLFTMNPGVLATDLVV